MVRVVLRWIDSPWPSVSSFHAELMVEGENIRVRDLGSTNGTFIDDRKTDEATLKPENILRLGNVRFQLDEVSVVPVAHPATPEAPVEEGGKIATRCVNHPAIQAAFICENCANTLCPDCVKVVGQGKFEATTICSVCQGQCHPLPAPVALPEPGRGPLLDRLTRTLRIPFSR
jgi:hypothetical protein